MSNATITKPQKVTEVVVREQPDANRPTWVTRLRSADHKVIATTLIGYAMIGLVLAGVTELLTWAQLVAPDNTFLSPEIWNRLHTLSDASYLYAFALPGLIGLALYVVPLQIGARSTAFPRLSALGAWSMVFGGAMLYLSIFVDAPSTSLQLSSPLTSNFYMSGSGVDYLLSTLILTGIGLTLISVDLLVTAKNMRADGLTEQLLPVFVSSVKIFCTAVLVTAPVLVAAAGLLMLERQTNAFGIFNTVHGGSALLWQVLYSWFAHGITILIAVVGVGITAEILATFTNGRVAYKRELVTALTLTAVIAVLGFGQNLYGAPIDGAWAVIFMVIGLALVVPFIMTTASLVATARQGIAHIEAPVLYALGFIVIFVSAMVDEIFMAIPPIGQWLTGSEFGLAHWGFFVAGCGLMAVFGGLHYWFPKITGRSYSPGLAKIAFAHIFFGTLAVLILMQSLGVDGLARSVSEYSSDSDYQWRMILIMLAALAASFGVLLALINFIKSSGGGAKAGNDPWLGSTLEWFAPSPPPANNFDVVPEVSSDTPLADLRAVIAAGSGHHAGSVAQPPTAGRPALRETPLQ